MITISRTKLTCHSVRKRKTRNANINSEGFCFNKATNGIKRHFAVDSLGFPL